MGHGSRQVAPPTPSACSPPPPSSRFGVRPLIFFGGGYLLFNGLFALIPIIRNLESVLAKQKEAREAEEAAD